jgi:hypothetical protein
MATAGILGMFVGATLLTLGYQIFMGWVAANPNAGQVQADSSAPMPMLVHIPPQHATPCSARIS